MNETTPVYVTCRCQHCDGHIEFDSSYTGETTAGREGAPPYPIGYEAIVPKVGECENLLVTFALSASHTAFSSIRMEPVFMVTSQSAGTAAVMAIQENVPVHKVDQAKLRTID